MTKQNDRNQLKSEYMTIANEQHDVSEDAVLKQQISSEPQKLRASICTRRKFFYTILLLVVIVGGIMALVIPYYTRHSENSNNNESQDIGTEDEDWNNDDQLPQLRSASISRSYSPKDLGHLNVYIRQSTRDDFRRHSRPFRFPAARYDHQKFPLVGPFLSLTPWIPIFIDRRSRQTIIYSPTGGLYIIPPLINFYGELYSVGELIKYGYASLVSSGGQPVAPINMLPYFQPSPLYGSGIPTINPLTGGFKGAIRTTYRRFNIPRHERISDDYSSYGTDDDDRDYYKPQPYHKKQNTYNNRYSAPNYKPPSYNPYYSPLNSCERYAVDQLKRQYLSSKVPENKTVSVPNTNPVKDSVAVNPPKNDSSLLDNCNCQKSILTPSELYEHGFFIILHLSSNADSSVKKACEQLSQIKQTLVQSHPDANIEMSLGLGYAITQKWLSEASIPFPKAFTEFKKIVGPTGKVMPSTGGDIFLDIRSNREDLCFELGRLFYNLISADSIDKLHDTFGFAYMSSKTTGLSKDFIGFEDGNDNPEGYQARAAAALIAQPNDDIIHAGGSFALTQKWTHNSTKWNEMTQKQQEDVIGRTKGDGSIEFKPEKPESHVGRTHIEENGIDVEIVRKSLPHGDLKKHGLFFVAYASSTKKHDTFLNSMVGNTNGIYDLLMDFTKPITGNYWYILSKPVLKKLLNWNIV